jgi:hypothetical protein
VATRGSPTSSSSSLASVLVLLLLLLCFMLWVRWLKLLLLVLLSLDRLRACRLLAKSACCSRLSKTVEVGPKRGAYAIHTRARLATKYTVFSGNKWTETFLFVWRQKVLTLNVVLNIFRWAKVLNYFMKSSKCVVKYIYTYINIKITYFAITFLEFKWLECSKRYLYNKWTEIKTNVRLVSLVHGFGTGAPVYMTPPPLSFWQILITFGHFLLPMPFKEHWAAKPFKPMFMVPLSLPITMSNY